MFDKGVFNHVYNHTFNSGDLITDNKYKKTIKITPKKGTVISKTNCYILYIKYQIYCRLINEINEMKHE